MLTSLEVILDHKTYPIEIHGQLKEAACPLLRRVVEQGRKSVVLTDSGVEAAATSVLNDVFPGLPRLVLAAGEQTKSLKNLGVVLDFLAAQEIDRHGIVWAVGGGVIGDLGGFAAACYLRGIECVQVPTTLLAMVDSSVGGKTGINLGAGKNLAGAFHHPKAVFIALDFLRTLPSREFAAGMAEVIKYGLLGDAALFAQLEATVLSPESRELSAVIRRCCAMKARLVQADERETAADGGRALLNLGHTFAHAIEQATRYESYLHGEAVAIGLAGAARLSRKLGYLEAGDLERIESVLVRHQLPIRLRQPLAAAALMESMKRDKKARAGQLRFIVLECVGQAHTLSGVDPALVAAVWRELGAAD